MAETLLSPSQETKRLRLAFVAAVLFAAALWLIKLVESGFDLQLDRFGIYPRSENGAWGILWSPLLHGSLSHLFANTAPIVILGTALLYGYPRAATRLLPILYLGTGLGVWLFGRAGYHIGASGLAFGMMFFIFTVGALRWDRRAIALSLIVFFLYGGMIWGILPQGPGVSFEAHLFGALLGVLSAFLFRYRDAAPPAKVYSWEGEEDGDEPGLDDYQDESWHNRREH
jgi:membrane associated rhomboid family serine protease